MANQNDGSPTDLIDSIKHPAVAATRRDLSPGGGSFIIDGRRLVSQGIGSRIKIQRVFFRHPVEGAPLTGLLDRVRRNAIDCHVVSRGVFFRVLGLGYETAVGVLAVARRPEPEQAATLQIRNAALLVGERIQDPRNVGVIIRTANAWTLHSAVFSRDSADPYSRAAVRSSTGAIFRVPIDQPEDLPACLKSLKEQSVRVIGTSARAKRLCWDADLTGSCAIVLGNESVGLSKEVRRVCDELVTIPMSGGAHSFNVTVAAGILLYERARQIGL
jgi:tRNA G18 (ribose-2'-O)-methylase SpoU